MNAPTDLDDPVQRATYRRELKAYARPWRRLGLSLFVAGIMVALRRGGGFDPLSLALVAGGWAILLPVIIARGRHHRRRMAEGRGLAGTRLR